MISPDECRQIMTEVLRRHGKNLDKINFDFQRGNLIEILSGKTTFRSLDFDVCPEEKRRFDGKIKNVRK